MMMMIMMMAVAAAAHTEDSDRGLVHARSVTLIRVVGRKKHEKKSALDTTRQHPQGIFKILLHFSFIWQSLV
jgi:hypothetical protein